MNIPIRTSIRNRLVGLLAGVALVALLSACGDEPATPKVVTDTDLGTPYSSADGLTVTITERMCGISGVGAEKPEFTAAGQYCTVGVTVDNGTGDEIDVTALKLTAWAGETEYFADYWAGTAADGGMQQTIGDGQALRSTLFFDVPAGTLLDGVTITSPWPGLSKVAVKF